MKIEQKEITKQIVDVAIIANYSHEDIAKLITNDLENRGYEVDEITFNISNSGYYDELGFVQNPIKTFEAIAKLS